MMIHLKNIKLAVTFVAALFFISACGQNKQTSNTATMSTDSKNTSGEHIATDNVSDNKGIDTATFGNGCFWCTEAIFQQLEGVLTVKSGYSGGFVKNPSYKEVCSGTTGHAEVIQLTYDKSKITFDELLEVFWKTHDPTTLNRQGNDVGTQYRSAVFFHNEEQKQIAEKYKAELNAAKVYPNPIVTEIKPVSNYFPAEDYHQNYYKLNGNEGYCQYVIQPKLEKFEKIFKSKMKKK